MIVLHQFAISPFCDKVRRILHRKQKPYEVREVAPSETRRALKKLNAVGKVPILEFCPEGRAPEIVCDSSAIARWLEERFPDPPLYPRDDRDRALCHVIEDWADESLYFFELYFRFSLPQNADYWGELASRSEHWALRPAARRAVPTLMAQTVRSQGLGKRSHEEILRDLERHLWAVSTWLGEGDWLTGEILTVADIATYVQLACVADTGDGNAVLSNFPLVLRWMERVNGATAGE